MVAVLKNYDGKKPKMVDIEKMIPYNDTAGVQHDVMLLKLKKESGKEFQPIELPDACQKPEADKEIQLMGWMEAKPKAQVLSKFKGQ